MWRKNVAIAKASSALTNVPTHINGEALDEGTLSGRPLEIEARADYGALKSPPIMSTSEHARDFHNGIRSVFYTNLVWAVLHACGFIILIIWRWFVLAHLVPIQITTIFSIFNSDPVDHPDQFYPTVWSIGNYPIDVFFTAIFGVECLACIAKVLTIWLGGGLTKLDSDYRRTGSPFIVRDASGNGPSLPPGQIAIQVPQRTKVTSTTSNYEFFDEVHYEYKLSQNFYTTQILVGEFWFRWLIWFITGGLLLWSVAATVGIQDIFQLACILLIFGTVVILAGVHEHINRIKLTNVDLHSPFEVVKRDEELLIHRRPKKWYAFILALLMNAWIWTVVFIYYGYAYVFEGAANDFPWYRLTAPVIVAGFYFIIVPVIVLAWTLWKPMGYKDIMWYYPVERQGLDNPTNPQPFSPSPDEELRAELRKSLPTRYSLLPDRLQRKVRDYMFWQDWNKNVVYEIVMICAGGLCKHVVIWILWGGLLA
jgi:hypothetical protein